MLGSTPNTPRDTAPCVSEDVSCEPRDVSGGPDSTSAHGAASRSGPPEVRTLEETLEQFSPLVDGHVDIVLRGTARPETFRCEWHGYAEPNDEREWWLRLLINLPSPTPMPSPSEIERVYLAKWEHIPPDDFAKWKALIYGGLVEDIHLRLYCTADYRVQEYLLGDGPSVMPIVHYVGPTSFTHAMFQQMQQWSGATAPVYTEAEYQAELDSLTQKAATQLSSLFGNREIILMLTPLAARHVNRSIAIEGWAALPAYDLQMAEDGTINAVAFGAPDGHPEQMLALANLKSRVTTAAASDAAAGQRIASITGLTQHYRDIGAYDDITPYDGSTDTFTPAQPPPVPECNGGTAVSNPVTNRGLVNDCSKLLDAEDTLRGTAALNWSKDLAIGSWDGVTTSGTPSRVTELDLSSESLSGTIPADLGTLFELTTLDLSSNSLTGSIPHELGWLYNLEELRLSGNSLTGCIPVALEDVATNDLSSLNLLYCAPPAPGNLTAGATTQTSVSLSWDTVPSTSKYRVEYRRLRSAGDWTTDTETLTTTSHTVDELECGSAYQFRVSAYGSGTTYAAAWSEPSTVLEASTSECAAPVFDEEL